MRLVTYGGEARRPCRQRAVNYQTVRMLERFAVVRTFALERDSLITHGDVMGALELGYETAKRQIAHWVQAGLLVYSGRVSEYRLPERAPAAPTHMHRWNELHALLVRTGRCDAQELATEVRCSWPTASAYLRLCKRRGQLVHVREGRFALHPEHVDPVAGERLLHERRRCAEALNALAVDAPKETP
jgi:hypothetical protein